jgi:hypothetical protein
MVFRLQTVAVNYIQGCPHALVSKIYFGRVLKDLVRSYSQIKAAARHRDLINKVALNSLTEQLIAIEDLPSDLL